MSAPHLLSRYFKQAAPGAGSSSHSLGGGIVAPSAPQEGSGKPPHQLRPPSQLRTTLPFWSHWSDKPETTTSFDFCCQVSFEPEYPRRTEQAFASLPGIWTGQKIPAAQARAGSPFFPEITVVVGRLLMVWLFGRAELLLCPPAFGGSISNMPWTAAEVRGGLEEVRVGSRSPSERIPAAPHNQHPPDTLLSSQLPLY